MIVDLFGGPGGWDLAARSLGFDPVGVELDEPTCRTRAAAGLRTIRADVAAMPYAHLAGQVAGLIGSPPCKAFSKAGKGLGRRDIPLITAEAWRIAARAPLPRAQLAASATDPSSLLVLEPLRWALDLRPEWVVLEQVDEVVPLWRLYAHLLVHEGYSTWAGVLCAADYGTPQTRMRAILLASRTRRAHPPETTHADLRKGGSLLGFAPWVSMAEALGWGFEDTPARTVCGNREPRWMFDGNATTGRTVVRSSYGQPKPDAGNGSHTFDPHAQPAQTVTGKARSWTVRTGHKTDWVKTGSGNGDAHDYERSVDRPAPSVTSRADRWTLRTIFHERAGDRSVPRTLDEPAPTLAFGHAAASWAFERPATTVTSRAAVGRPGHKDREHGESHFERDAIRLELWQAAVLQDFPACYPWQGTKTQRFGQVGNAVPVRLARAILAAVTGRAATGEQARWSA